MPATPSERPSRVPPARALERGADAPARRRARRGAPRRRASPRPGSPTPRRRGGRRPSARERPTPPGPQRPPTRPRAPTTSARERGGYCFAYGRPTAAGGTAADHAGDGDQRQHVRKGLEEDGAGVGVRRRGGTRARSRQPNSIAARERAERPPVAEDERGERDEAAAGGHVLVERVDEADREVRAAERGEHAGDDRRRCSGSVDGDADGLRRARMLADRAQAQPERRPEDDDVRRRSAART